MMNGGMPEQLRHDPGPSAARHYYRRIVALRRLADREAEAFARLIDRARWAELSDPAPHPDPQPS
jgi:hypothetical protein